MPTENRSSNTEMVSVPEGFMLVERSIWTEQQVEAATACITRLKGVPGMRDCDLAMAAIDAAQCKAPDIALSDLLPAPQPHPDPIAWMVGTAFWWTKEEAERDAAATGLPIVGLGPMTAICPVKQHQSEPVAVVDEGEEGLFVDFIYGDDGNSLRRGDKLYARSTSNHACLLRETVRELRDPSQIGWEDKLAERIESALSTHADPGEVERLREQLAESEECYRSIAMRSEVAAGVLNEQEAELKNARSLLRESYTELLAIKAEIGFRGATIALIGRIDAALSASVEPSAPLCTPIDPCVFPDSCGHCSKEPSAPVERDERAEFEKAGSAIGIEPRFLTGREWRMWQARAALERKP